MQKCLVEFGEPYSGDLPEGEPLVIDERTPLAELTTLEKPEDLYLVNTDGEVTRKIEASRLFSLLQEELKSCDAFLETIMGTLEDAVTVVDERSRVRSINAKSEKLYGLTRGQIQGQPIDDFFEEEALVLWSVMQDKRPVLHHYNQPRPDLHVIVNTAPVFSGVRCVGGVSIERDITDVVKLNEELATTTASLHDLAHSTNQDHPFEKIKGRSERLRHAIGLASKVARTDANVLITGESGVGKELFAEGIHRASERASRPFIAINCGAIPHALFESELFGYEQGAFTGAARGGKKGKFDAARGGTVFLDEIGEMPLELQVKLLRVLQERSFYRVGGTKAIPMDVRLVAATNRDLEKMVEEGTFREDLYYRLHVISIKVPALRERIEDLPELVQVFLKEFALKYDKPIPKLDPEVMYSLSKQPWEGNIRQLRNLIERMIILNGDQEEQVKWHHLPESFQRRVKHITSAPKVKRPRTEQEEIEAALEKTYGNKSAAAKILGVSRATLYNRMKRLGL
ncbi:sigma-54 interaction domain-containing protein [Shouchella shacheensis]|uniref:sigma-54 interaction domain-containing protein n=1 Tax=Shouchella shacheensis TaxID=1649580 RepID=UPI00073FE2BB|nr:sigma 54-interacting transcriptional regulator [Shouchella shacheensis]